MWSHQSPSAIHHKLLKTKFIMQMRTLNFFTAFPFSSWSSALIWVEWLQVGGESIKSIFFLTFSKLAVFDGKKAIRGGIPFVFRKPTKLFHSKRKGDTNFSIIPAQFGPWSFGPQHGFARITRWTLERPPERLHNGDVEALFSLMDNDFTRSMWNYP